MRIAIHNGSSGFHPRWITYCKQQSIPFKLVNCYANDIIEQLNDCDALMWHHQQGSPNDLIAAKPILFALEHARIKVFPDFKTNWHFDDKLGQKYLLEALGIPFVKTYVFYDKKEALGWASKTTFPKVFKLRGGAGSANVKMAKTKEDAFKLINKAFGKGFPNYDALGSLKERYRKWRLGKTNFIDLVKGFIRIAYPPPFSKVVGREVGYVYFQDFIPKNNHDIRIIVIGEKAFAIKRLVRINDFKASGSGHIIYSKENFNESDVKLAFEINIKLNSQCTAMDFIYNDFTPALVEISYGFVPEGYDACPGYWDSEMNWHEGSFDPYGWMIDELLKATK